MFDEHKLLNNDHLINSHKIFVPLTIHDFFYSYLINLYSLTQKIMMKLLNNSYTHSKFALHQLNVKILLANFTIFLASKSSHLHNHNKYHDQK